MGIETTDSARQLDRLLRVGTVGGMTDSQLLEQFVSGDADSAGIAFEAIVERHGRMVMRICRAVLSDSHAAEDAFQATFLVLARKARGVGSRELLANWLYGVALRTARKAKVMAARRQIRDRKVALLRPIAIGDSDCNRSRTDMEQLVHDEIDRLPGPYRAVVVVCYFEGMSQMEAARQLCLTEATVRGRLARARKLLSKRLMRRGVMPSTGLGWLAKAQGAWWQPSVLITQATAEAAVLYAKRVKATSAAVSATAQGLANGVLSTMWFSSLKMTASILIAVGFLVAGAALVAQHPAETRLHAGIPQAQDDVEITSEAGAHAQDEPPHLVQTQGKKKGQRQSPGVALDLDLVKAAAGPIIRAVPISQDVSIIAYLPNQNLGHVDNMAMQNAGGGVRVLLDWPPIPSDAGDATDRRYLITLYSKETHSSPPAGRIHAFEVLEGWREMTTWSTKPRYDPEPAASFNFEPGTGWKLFDITTLVRDQAKSGRTNHGILLRFVSEDAPANALSGYDLVSREGAGEWANRHPVLLVCKRTGDE